MYKFVLGKRPKTTIFGEVTIWKFKFLLDIIKEEVVSTPTESINSSYTWLKVK